MIDTNELRRLAQAATPGPWKILPVGDGRQKFAVADRKSLSILTVTDEGEATFGTVYDDADAKFIAAANPAAISELIDRLEAAEKETASWKELAKQFGNEADALRIENEALRAEVIHIKEVEFPRKAQAVADGWRGKLEAAEEERDDVAQQLVQSEQGKRKISEERDALSAELSKQQTLTVAAQHIAEVAQSRANQLQAKITEMEQQEPVAWRTFDGEGGYDFRGYEGNENYKLGWDARNPNHAGWVEPLYALPGAKGEEK